MSSKEPSQAPAYSESSWPSVSTNAITRLNGYDADAITYIPVVIVGAGESGIAMGCRLKQKLGFDQFRIFDRQSGSGGTWHINRYPGVACDVPAVFYSFSFAPNHSWTTFHPPGPEIVKYLDDVCRKFEITDKIQCNTDIKGCRWLEAEKLWEVELRYMVPGTGDLSLHDRNQKIAKHGEHAVYLKTEIIRAKIVISAVGGLVEPNTFPEQISGREQFKGEIFHSARWRYDVDLKDKNVIVLGTGCSAAQFVPRLTKDYHAKKVTQLMRSPPWVVPRIQPPFGKKAWEKHSSKILRNVPGVGWLLRQLLAAASESEWVLFGQSDKSVKAREKYEKLLLDHLKKNAPEKYHEMLTPDYGVGCKRRLFDATWFPGLHDDDLELTTQTLKRVQANSVVLSAGQTYPKNGPQISTDEREVEADVIILANGFNTTKWLHPLAIKGRDGQDLVEVMEQRGGPQAYQGTAMDGFPNFFMIFGPNTATGHSSVILASENMIEYSLKFIKKILNGDVETVEVKREAEEAYTKDIQRGLKSTVWMTGGCASWYFTDDGWNGTVLPYGQIWFGLRCMFPKWADWNISYTTKGLIKLRAVQLLKVLLTAVTFVGAYRARQSGQGFRYLGNILNRSRNAVLTSAIRSLQLLKA